MRERERQRKNSRRDSKIERGREREKSDIVNYKFIFRRKMQRYNLKEKANI